MRITETWSPRKQKNMASKDSDHIDFSKLEKELSDAVAADEKYWRENDAKFRAVHQKVASYEEFRDIVLAAHLKPLDKKDKIQDTFKQPWNAPASGSRQEDSHKNPAVLQRSDKIPSNGHEFARDWRRLGDCKRGKYSFLINLGGTTLAKIFKAEIGFGLLGEILGALMDYKREDYKEIVSILDSLTTVNRFSLSVQFLSSSEKEMSQKLFSKLCEELTLLNDVERGGTTEETLSDIMAKYDENK